MKSRRKHELGASRTAETHSLLARGADSGHAEDLDPYLSLGCSLGRKSVAPVRLLAPVGGVLTLQSVERVGDVTWLVVFVSGAACGVRWWHLYPIVLLPCVRRLRTYLFFHPFYLCFLFLFFLNVIVALNSRWLYICIFSSKRIKTSVQYLCILRAFIIRHSRIRELRDDRVKTVSIPRNNLEAFLFYILQEISEFSLWHTTDNLSAYRRRNWQTTSIFYNFLKI